MASSGDFRWKHLFPDTQPQRKPEEILKRWGWSRAQPMSPGLCTCPPHSRAGSGVSAFLLRCKHAGWAPKLASKQVNPAFEQDLHIPRTQNKPTPPRADGKGAWLPNFEISEGENSLFQSSARGASILLFSSLFPCYLQDRWFPSPLQAIKQNFLMHSYHHVPQGLSRKRNIAPKLQKASLGSHRRWQQRGADVSESSWACPWACFPLLSRQTLAKSGSTGSKSPDARRSNHWPNINTA